jgi:hypothetical protein
VRELKHIEYKRRLPGRTDPEKLEFLKDVSSFANAAGGDLVYGMAEVDGVPTELCGLGDVQTDKEILRLEETILRGVQPRLLSVRSQPVELSAGGVALVIRVPRSWRPPHRVSFLQHDKFWTRATNGKHDMDVTELRDAFALAGDTADRIRDLREGRLARIVAGETPVPLPDGPKIVLHVVPIGAFDPGARVDSRVIAQEAGDGSRTFHSAMQRRHNFDGFLVYIQFDPDSGPAEMYAQIFRSGAVEVVDTRWGARNGEHIISWEYESSLREALRDCLALQKRLGIEPPVFVMLSLLGVRGYSMQPYCAPLANQRQQTPIDRDDLIIPEGVIEDFNCDADEVLRLAFDAVGNACGYPRAMNYDDSGK